MCHGDSGGPLVTEDKRTLVGITSFGALCETTLAPNGFSRISHYYDWIQEQICELSANPQSSCPPSDPETNPEAVAMNITLQVSKMIKRKHSNEIFFKIHSLIVILCLARFFLVGNNMVGARQIR